MSSMANRKPAAELLYSSTRSLDSCVRALRKLVKGRQRATTRRIWLARAESERGAHDFVNSQVTRLRVVRATRER